MRGALIPVAHLKRVSRTAGWISPVVLVGGRVAGVWTSQTGDGPLRITVDMFGRSSAAVRRAIAAAAEVVAATQAKTAGVEYGPVFTTPSTASTD